MLQVAVLVRRSTLRALYEHSNAVELGGEVPVNDRESLVLLSADVLRRVLDLADPTDTRIDDVIMRAAL